MYTARCVLVLLSVLGFVVGIINADNCNKSETESKVDLEDYINKILNKWETKFFNKLIIYIDNKTDGAYKEIPQLEERIKKIEEKIDQTSNASNNTMHVLEVNMTETFDRMKKELLQLNRTLTNVACAKLPPLLHGSAELLNGTTYFGSVVQYSCDTNYRLVGPAWRTCVEGFQWSETAPTCEVDCGQLPPLSHGSVELLTGTTHLGSVVQYSCATNYRMVGPARRTCTEDFQWSETAPICEGLCKEETVAWYRNTPWYSLDDLSLHYGTLQKDSTGNRVYLELHLAVQMEGWIDIQMSEKVNSSDTKYSLWLGYSNNKSNKRTLLWYRGDPVRDIHTPSILSPTRLRSFYIKVDAASKLQFGKEGDAPLISYSDAGLGSVNYYRFVTYGGPTIIRFCPDAVEESS